MPTDDIDLHHPAALSALVSGDPANARVASTLGGIERQERQGQTSLVANFDRLPKDGLFDELAALRRAGFSIGDALDDLFVAVAPPPGWTLMPTDHAMWSTLKDERSRKRGSVFYKAAFYDRRASLYLDTRYAVERVYEETLVRIIAKDRATGELLGSIDIAADENDPWEASGAATSNLKHLLDDRFPAWKDAAAYW